MIWRGRRARRRFSALEHGDDLDLESLFRQIDACYDRHANPFSYYRRLVDGLRAIEGLEILPLAEMPGAPQPGRRVVSLRHDVDADPVAALRCARHLARCGLSGSFYLLHTAPYWGREVGGVWLRRSELVSWVRALLVAGSEIGLHNDALFVYQTLGRDGAACLAAEIAWLRAQGVTVRGTVAHNTGVTYGAENSEIFAGRTLWRRQLRDARGVAIPLGTLDERALGLEYEGGFASPRSDIDPAAAAAFFADRAASDLRSETWMRRYLLENPTLSWRLERQIWLIGRDRWVIAGSPDVFLWDLDLEAVLEHLRELPDGARASVVVHPEYVRGVGERVSG